MNTNPHLRDPGRSSSRLYPKIAEDLKQSPLYQKHNLSYEDLNFAYKRSRSIPSFAVELLELLFSHSELKKCLNVYGRAPCSPITTHKCLDPHRVSLIRQIIEENYLFDRTLWRQCVTRMNTRIEKLKNE